MANSIANVIIYTSNELANQKFADLAPIYNILADKMGQKLVKKFSDKPTSIARILKIQGEWEAANPVKEEKPAKAEKKAKAEKPAKAEKVRPTLTLGVEEIKEGTTVAVIADGIQKHNGDFEAVVQHVLDHYSRPRSGNDLTRAIVIRRINRAIAAGSIAAV